MDNEYYISLVKELIKYPSETEWIEFKHNNEDPDEIGEYISALSNSATIVGKVNAYLVWGIDDSTHQIIGTMFDPFKKKINNEAFENWLLKLLTPKINFFFHTLNINAKTIVLLEISSAFRHPVQFKNIEYIRVGSYKKKLKEFPEKERELWRLFDKTPFEKQIAAENIDNQTVLKLIDYNTYFTSLQAVVPNTSENILSVLETDEMIKKNSNGNWDITNLGAILFANDLDEFNHLKRKSIRCIIYKGISRIATQKEWQITIGYIKGFKELIDLIPTILPSSEIISGAIRKEQDKFPILAIRELIANSLIHQDFFITGTGPTFEIFEDRLEITNPGTPLVKTDRFLDSPPKSRNEALASFMRRVGICEERGSGIDKVVEITELYQLPAPIFEVTEEHTRSVLFAHKEFRQMYKEERIRACYLHACLKYAQREYMTNTSLRGRFDKDNKNRAQISRIIKDTINEGLIKCYDETVGSRARRYIPYWA